MKHIAGLLLLIAGLYTLTSCVSRPHKEEPVAASKSVRKRLERAEIKKSAGSLRQALAQLKSIVKSYPKTDVADDAYIMMGEIYYQGKDFKSAYRAYMSVVDSKYFSPREIDALIGAAKSLLKLGRYDEALALTDQGLQFESPAKSSRLALYRLRFSLFNQLGDRLDALKAAYYLTKNEDSESQRQHYKQKAIGLIEMRLTNSELVRVADNSAYGFLQGYALFRVGSIFFERRKFKKAKDFLADVSEVLPDSQLAEKADEMIKQINARRKVNPLTVGTVLPLTGKHKFVSEQTLRGLQLGLGIFGKDRSRFRLAILDSERNPDAARRAVERLVTEDHVMAIVGSLLSKTSVAVASKANELGVPTIGLSQKSGLTDVGNFVFRNALTSEMIVRQLVQLAMDKEGMKNFAILYPNDRYGVEYANLFWDEVRARGGTIIGAQPYPPGETDFNGNIKRLVGTYYFEDREQEYRLLLEEWVKEQESLSGRISPPNNLLKPIVDFDALFIPDSTRAVGQIAPMLAYHNIQDVKLLGTNLWNTRSLIKRGKSYVQNAIFVDGLLRSDPKFRRSRFYKLYKSTFGERPGIFAVQAYDAGLILREIIASGARSRMEVRNRLADIKNFQGSLGPLRITSRREVMRPLRNLTVKNRQIKVYKPTSNKKQ